MRRLILPTILFANLSACGGSSPSTPTPTPTSSNSPPAFTSPATVSVAENQALAYQAAASDPNGDAVAYSIAGGSDAAQFTLDGTGKLSFNTAPNFDDPQDSNGDNVYEVTLRASDGSANTALNLLVTVTNSKEGIAVRRIATGFNQPIQIHAVEGNPNLLYVAERGGNLYELNTQTGARSLLVTLPNVSTDGERGFIGFAVDVDDRNPGNVNISIMTMSTRADGTIAVDWYIKNQFGLVFQSWVQPTLLTIPHATYSNHNGGWIAFGPSTSSFPPDLFIGVGDGGGTGDPANNAQNPNSRLGKILRLQYDPNSGGASVNFWTGAPGNPFASGAGGDPYIFALGLRNPFRAAFEGNDIIIGDVGQNAVEEIDILSTTSPGPNLGWPYLEGTESYKGTAPGGLTGPVLQYRHGNGNFQGSSVIGGLVYHGPIASLEGKYIFADFVSHHIWAVPYTRLKSGPLLDGRGYEVRDSDFAPDAGSIDQPVAFGKGSDGRAYVVDLDGEIFAVDAG